jgi:hypothetical protein
MCRAGNSPGCNLVRRVEQVFTGPPLGSANSLRCEVEWFALHNLPLGLGRSEKLASRGLGSARDLLPRGLGHTRPRIHSAKPRDDVVSISCQDLPVGRHGEEVELRGKVQIRERHGRYGKVSLVAEQAGQFSNESVHPRHCFGSKGSGVRISPLRSNTILFQLFRISVNSVTWQKNFSRRVICPEFNP